MGHVGRGQEIEEVGGRLAMLWGAIPMYRGPVHPDPQIDPIPGHAGRAATLTTRPLVNIRLHVHLCPQLAKSKIYIENQCPIVMKYKRQETW